MSCTVVLDMDESASFFPNNYSHSTRTHTCHNLEHHGDATHLRDAVLLLTALMCAVWYMKGLIAMSA